MVSFPVVSFYGLFFLDEPSHLYRKGSSVCMSVSTCALGLFLIIEKKHQNWKILFLPYFKITLNPPRSIYFPRFHFTRFHVRIFCLCPNSITPQTTILPACAFFLWKRGVLPRSTINFLFSPSLSFFDANSICSHSHGVGVRALWKRWFFSFFYPTPIM